MLPNSCGIGLKTEHYQQFSLNLPKEVAWVEVHAENFFNSNSYIQNILEIVSKNYLLSFHCVGLSLGSVDLINMDHLKKLRSLVDKHKPALISDHLAWVGVGGAYFHDLLPFPYTPESLNNFINKVSFVQDYLGRQILIENPSLYASFNESVICESDFLNTLVDKSGCGLLLDLNNLHITSHNLKFDPLQYLKQINQGAVQEIHLAGYEKLLDQKIIVDTHSEEVSEGAADLFKKFISRYGPRPTLYERDQKIPELTCLLDEAKRINKIIKTLA
jgi:hypothetical protein